MRLLLMISLAAAQCFAGTWFGRLVDSKCYEFVEGNVNPTDTLIYVDRDKNWEISFCAPTGKTKSFTVVEPTSQSFKLDPGGDLQAAALLRRAGRHPDFYVTVTGEIIKDTITVRSIVPVNNAAASGSANRP
jgi:hypothetical protein